MGLLTNLKPQVWPSLPWLHQDHPLQNNSALHFGIKGGLCGCLTTFASWNTQMVVLLDGHDTIAGRQVTTALWGYFLGLVAALSSFIFGEHLSAWMNSWRQRRQQQQQQQQHRGGPPSSPNNELQVVSVVEHSNKQAPTKIVVYPSFFGGPLGQARNCWAAFVSGTTLPVILLLLLFAAFVVADQLLGIPHYRSLWLSALFTPVGAILRWRLSLLNYQYGWVPWGTLLANLLGSTVSALLLAMELRYVDSDDVWRHGLVAAGRVGFAGSLSTVSTFVKELVDISSKFPLEAKAYKYGGATIVSSMILSLLTYSIIVRT